VSVNVHRPHLIVIPEDKANRDIINGFSEYLEINQRQFWVEDLARGWTNGSKRLDELARGHMIKYTHSYAVLVIDFDGQEDRGSKIRLALPKAVRDRIFIIGALSEPESLRDDTGLSYEGLGRQMAKSCSESNFDFWQRQKLLRHNMQEVGRLSESVSKLFFTRENNI
jgi:hypothetical protein